jgi:3-hydroxyacyl-[acyl-carrier-protein] dehydratase
MKLNFVFLMGVEKARFRSSVIPDCKLLLKLKLLDLMVEFGKYKGEAFVNDKKMADRNMVSKPIVDKK